MKLKRTPSILMIMFPEDCVTGYDVFGYAVRFNSDLEFVEYLMYACPSKYPTGLGEG